MRTVITIVLVLGAARGAGAQDATAVAASEAHRTETTIRFLAGAAIAFGLHETGHVIAGVSFGAGPRVQRIDYGVIPFFAIHHRSVPPRQEYVISAAGFWVQHAGSEWLLSTHPDLRHEDAPLRKGMLAFNLAASAVYGVAAFGRFGPPERDTRGMAVSLGEQGIGEPVVGVLVLGPAVLDGYRYLRPDQAWAKWASRGLKVAGVVMIAAARR